MTIYSTWGMPQSCLPAYAGYEISRAYSINGVSHGNYLEVFHVLFSFGVDDIRVLI